MNKRDLQAGSGPELDDDDRTLITQIFHEEVVEKLKRMGARIGTLNCAFAGKRYRDWTLHFRSSGPGFEIVDFEYDEDSRGFSLDP